MVTIRVSDHSGSNPVGLVIPGETASSFHANLRNAVADAEETYWSDVAPWLKDVALKRGDDVDSMFLDIQDWHQRQDWNKVARAATRHADGHPLSLLSHVGHVAIMASRPSSRIPVLAIFDPTQLRRVDRSFERCVQGAASHPMDQAWPLRADAALREMNSDPWLEPGSVPEISKDVALQRQTEIYEDFLRRSPYKRPDEHNVYPDNYR
jgi:hypothetical protein